MRAPLPLPLLTVAVIFVVSLATSVPRSACADDDEARDRAFCARVIESPVTLLAAVSQATPSERIALAAKFALDAEQRLTLSVTTVGPAADADDFDEVNGLVLADRWQPVRRPLADRAEVAAAARAQTLLAQGEWTIARILAKTLELWREGHAKTPPAVIAVRPALLERKAWLVGEVAHEGVPHATRWSLAEGWMSSLEAPAYVKEREAAARRRVGKPLPEFDVPGGRWLNATSPPSVAKRDGRPLLVVLTNRLCEMECGPKATVVAKWQEAYGSRGLDVVSVYRERASWNPSTSMDDMAALVRANGLRHPVLLDWQDAYIKTLEPGPIGYPVAFVVGPDGVVRWEGDSSAMREDDFAAKCEAAIKAAITPAGAGALERAPR